MDHGIGGALTWPLWQVTSYDPSFTCFPHRPLLVLIPAGESDGLGVAMVWNTLEIPDKFPG